MTDMSFKKHQRFITDGNMERRRLHPNTNPGTEYNSGLYINKRVAQPATNFIGRKAIRPDTSDALVYHKRKPWNIHESGLPVLRTKKVLRQYSTNCA